MTGATTMHTRARVAVVGDLDPRKPSHRFTSDALDHIGLAFDWVATEDVGDPASSLARFDGFWISPASPYRSMEGALAAIRHARERGVPLVGT